MLPIANEPNMVSGNGVNNCKDLKGSFNHETDSQKLPERTILYGQKDRERIASQYVDKSDLAFCYIGLNPF